MLENEIGKRILVLRANLKLSRPKFAAMLGIPPTTVKNYELGYRTSLPAELLNPIVDNWPGTEKYRCGLAAALYLLTGEIVETGWWRLHDGLVATTVSDRLKELRALTQKTDPYFASRPIYAQFLGFVWPTYKNYELGYRKPAMELMLGLYKRFGAAIMFWVLTGRYINGKFQELQIQKEGYLFDGNPVTEKEYRKLVKQRQSK